MSRFGSPLFAPRYDGTEQGLVSAEQELARLSVLRDAYAAQPDITPIWQGYIDQKADDVARQQAVVDRLRARVVNHYAEAAEAAARRVSIFADRP